MILTDAILWLRKLGIGRSLSASAIVNELDKYLFPDEIFYDDDGNRETKQDNLERKIFCARIEEWLNVPVVPSNRMMIVAETKFNTSGEWVEYFEEMYESKSWCKGLHLFYDREEDDLTQLDAIRSFLRASEVVKYLLSGKPWNVKDEECVLATRCAISKFSDDFWMAGEYFKSALFPTEFETQSLEIWANEDSYRFSDTDCEDLTKRFCEVVMALNGENGDFYDWDDTSFFLPADLSPWHEDEDFLLEIGILGKPSWDEHAFHYEEIFQVALNHPSLTESFDRWIRNFNDEYSPSKWAYYFWEQPFDAAVWADCGFRPVEAALWNSIEYDTPDALDAFSNDWEYSSVAPIVRAGMEVTKENVKLWGNAESSSEILDAIDRGFPEIDEYQKYKTIDSDYSTIQRFNEFSNKQLPIEVLSRAIALGQSWMEIKDAIAWSKFDQPLTAVVEFKLAKRTPLQASKWIECGIPLSAALKWVSLGLSQKEALLWIEQEIDLEDASWFLELKIKNPHEVKQWLKYFSRAEIQTAIDRGFRYINDYKKYKDIESDFSNITRFIKQSKDVLSMHELSRAITLEQHGMKIDDSINWSKIDQKFLDVVAFNLAKQSPAQATKWIEFGFQLDIAIKWVSLGLSVYDAFLWQEQEIDHEGASWFLELKIDDPHEAKQWLRYIPQNEIRIWREAGFEPSSADDWREIGFEPKTSLEWLNQGVNTAKEAGKWLENKFDLKEAIRWIVRSISPENARKWKDTGISPEIAERREQAGIKP